MNYFQGQIFSSFSKGLPKKFDIYAIEFAPVGLIYLLSRILDTRQSKIYSRYYYENEKSSINNCLNVRNVVAIYLFRPRSHYAGAIWKRKFHSENALNVFRPHYAGEI